MLDEPTAALDAETEHALFERYAAAARGNRDSGQITSPSCRHRFSTVRMADLIVVLKGARLLQFGTHEELKAKGGHYAELYNIQARLIGSRRDYPARLSTPLSYDNPLNEDAFLHRWPARFSQLRSISSGV